MGLFVERSWRSSTFAWGNWIRSRGVHGRWWIWLRWHHRRGVILLQRWGTSRRKALPQVTTTVVNFRLWFGQSNMTVHSQPSWSSKEDSIRTRASMIRSGRCLCSIGQLDLILRNALRWIHFVSAKLQAVQVLIDFGANVDIANEGGATPLHICGKRGSVSVAKVSRRTISFRCSFLCFPVVSVFRLHSCLQISRKCLYIDRLLRRIGIEMYICSVFKKSLGGAPYVRSVTDIAE